MTSIFLAFNFRLLAFFFVNLQFPPLQIRISEMKNCLRQEIITKSPNLLFARKNIRRIREGGDLSAEAATYSEALAKEEAQS